MRIGLSIRADEIHVMRVTLCRGCRAKIDLATLVENQDVVEVVVGSLRSLVNGDAGGGTVDIGSQA